MLRSGGLGSLMLLALGCSDPNGLACTEEAVFGLSVTVRDSVTGVPAGQGASVVARDGAWQENLQAIFPDDLTFAGAVERAGTYQITVMKLGYTTWIRTGVLVAEGVCHVTPALVEVRLQPAAAGS